MNASSTTSRAETVLLDAIKSALEPICRSMEVDGYRLTVDRVEGHVLSATVAATEGACEECLVPKGVMELILLDTVPETAALQEVALTYPAETAS